MNREDKLAAFLARTPYARFLNFGADLSGDAMIAVLPFDQLLIGNPSGPALHGGVIGAFLELAALAELSLSAPAPRGHRAIDINIEYLRPGRDKPTYARAEVRKLGRRFVNVHVEAWQDRRDKPVALLRGNFQPAAET